MLGAVQPCSPEGPVALIEEEEKGLAKVTARAGTGTQPCQAPALPTSPQLCSVTGLLAPPLPWYHFTCFFLFPL